MLLLVRLLTAGVIYTILLACCRIGMFFLDGGPDFAFSGNAAEGFLATIQMGYSNGYRYGVALAQKWGGVTIIATSALIAVVAYAIAFSGLLSWCRKKTVFPPKLPKAVA